MKSMSAGLIITDGKSFLGCHSTGNDFYDLPKGTVEEGEKAIDTCIREVYEETNLLINKNEIIDLGEFSYNNYKDLHLFMLYSESLPRLENLKCNSFFYHPELGVEKPEADGYLYISFDEMEAYLTNHMFNVLTTITNKLLKKEKQPS